MYGTLLPEHIQTVWRPVTDEYEDKNDYPWSEYGRLPGGCLTS